MAGKLIVVTQEIDLAFDGRAAGAGTTDQDAVLARIIPTFEWESGLIIVRMHAKASWSGTAAAQVLVQNVQIPPEEPQTLFVVTAPIATVPIANGDAAPKVYTYALSSPIGPAVRVLFRWQQGTSPGAGPQTISISADLVGRT